MKALLFANTDWYLYNFRLPLALALQKRGDEVVMVSPPGPYAARIEQAGVRWRELSLSRRSLDPRTELRAVSAMARVLRDERPDLLHNFTVKCTVQGSLAAKLVGGPPVVNAIAGLGTVFSSTAPHYRALRVALLGTLGAALFRTHVIFQNPEDLHLLTARRIVSPRRAHLIRGSGVDTERFSPADASASPPTVVFASRLLWAKGLAELESAAKRIKRRDPSVRFLVAGAPDPGNPDAIPGHVIERWRHEQTLEPLGHVEDTAALYRTADIAVLPTSYGEGVPRTLLEAAASGLPIVATNTAGCREIVEHGRNGLLVAPGDAHGLAEALESLLGSPVRRAAMGREGRRIAVERYAEERVIEATLGVYADAIQRRSGARAS